MSVNRYLCTGRLTKDPELRRLTEHTAVCDLRVAVDGMGRGREVGFINVRVFGPPGIAAAEHLTKGFLVAIDGRLEFAEWESDSGFKRHDYTIVGSVEFLSAPRSASEASAAIPAATFSPDTDEPTPGERILLA
jgi:single-strand DNA-binding protein